MLDGDLPGGFATLESGANPDQVGNAGGQYASQQGPGSGVLAVFNTDFTAGPLGRSAAETVPFGTAYAYASGDQSSTNNYNISPGMPNSAWKVAVTQLDCSVDTPPVTIAGEGSQEPAVSQDGTGGVYATYRAGAGGPVGVSAESRRSHAAATRTPPPATRPGPAGGG